LSIEKILLLPIPKKLPNKSPPSYSHDPAPSLFPLLQAKKNKKEITINYYIKWAEKNHAGGHVSESGTRFARSFRPE
jgi:hypothetical protein